MEVQIQELIDKIKTDGLEKAEKAGAELIAEAKEKAAAIIGEARKEADRLLAEAKTEANKFQSTGKQAVVQAGRDLILNIRAQLSKLFAAIIEGEVAGVLNSYFLESTLIKLVGKWAETGNQELEVLLSESDLKKMETYFNTKLKEKLKNGVELKTSPGVLHGFRIGEKNGAAFFDLTDQGIAESLKPFLNEKLAACIDEALKLK